MQEDLMKADHSFMLDNFEVSLKLEGGLLRIYLISIGNAQFEALLTTDSIPPEIKCCNLKTVEELTDFLAYEMGEKKVKITPNGTIKFEYAYVSKGNIKTVNLSLETKEKLGKYEEVIERIVQENKKIMAQNIQLKNQVLQISKKLELLAIKYEELRVYQGAHQREFIFNPENWKKIDFVVDKNCPYLNNFIIDGISIVRKGGDKINGAYQIYGEIPMLREGRSYFELNRAVASTNKVIVGLITNQSKGEKQPKKRSLVTNRAKKGQQFYPFGIAVKPQRSWDVSQTLTIAIDMNVKTVCWYVERELVFESAIRLQFQNQDLFPVVCLEYIGDCIQIVK